MHKKPLSQTKRLPGRDENPNGKILFFKTIAETKVPKTDFLNSAMGFFASARGLYFSSLPEGLFESGGIYCHLPGSLGDHTDAKAGVPGLKKTRATS